MNLQSSVEMPRPERSEAAFGRGSIHNVASYARFLGNEECAVIVEAHVAKTHVNGLLDKLGFNKPVAP